MGGSVVYNRPLPADIHQAREAYREFVAGLVDAGGLTPDQAAVIRTDAFAMCMGCTMVDPPRPGHHRYEDELRTAFDALLCWSPGELIDDLERWGQHHAQTPTETIDSIDDAFSEREAAQ